MPKLENQALDREQIDNLVVSSPELSAALPGLIHGSTTRMFNQPDSPRDSDLLKLRELLGITDQPLILCQQKHTSRIGIVDDDTARHARESGKHVFPETDGIVSALPGMTLVIMTADCTPLFLADTRRRVLGLVHAGWRGTFGRIAQNAVEAMCSLGSDPADIIAWIGPVAGGCCYEVSEEMIRDFELEFSDAAKTGVTISRGRLLDIAALNRFQLTRSGIPPQSIFFSNFCTIHHSDRFYSYRADNGTHGRIFSILSLPD